jgi:hypothetical protein
MTMDLDGRLVAVESALYRWVNMMMGQSITAHDLAAPAAARLLTGWGGYYSIPDETENAEHKKEALRRAQELLRGTKYEEQ